MCHDVLEGKNNSGSALSGGSCWEACSNVFNSGYLQMADYLQCSNSLYEYDG